MLFSKQKNLKPISVFHSHEYLRHNQRRLEHLASLGLDIHGKTVLEVGAGIGDHTHFFADRQCAVTSTDARIENVDIIKQRYSGITAFQFDLDNPQKAAVDRLPLVDVVYCYGLLYHLSRPAEAIAMLAKQCTGMMLLETCVSPGDDDSVNPVREETGDPSQSNCGIGCRPTRSWVYKQLALHFEFQYMPRTQPWHEQFPLDWTPNAVYRTHCRSVFVGSRRRLDSPILCSEIPLIQMRH